MLQTLLSCFIIYVDCGYLYMVIAGPHKAFGSCPIISNPNQLHWHIYLVKLTPVSEASSKQLHLSRTCHSLQASNNYVTFKHWSPMPIRQWQYTAIEHVSSFVPITEIDNDSLLIMIIGRRPDIHRSRLTSEINYLWLARDLAAFDFIGQKCSVVSWCSLVP